MNISILYFSGTGNTEMITSLLVNEFKKYQSVDMFKIEDILLRKVDYDIKKYDIIGIGYPIYGFNPSFNVFELVKTFNNSTNRKVFLFSTCAGPLYLNDIASYGLKNKLYKKGFSIIYEKQFYMPSNIIVRYKDEVVKQLYNAAVKKIKIMIDDIKAGTVKVRDDGVFPLFFQWMYLIFEKVFWVTVPLDFKITKKCNVCLKCVNQCPQNNIRLRKNKIRFGKNCLSCYRCVYNCPQKAITGRLYKIAILKDGYNIKPILENNQINDNYVTKDTKGYYKIFYKYLNE